MGKHNQVKYNGKQNFIIKFSQALILIVGESYCRFEKLEVNQGL